MSKLESHKAGETVIRQGDFARDMYVVVDGTLEVWIERNDEHKVLATLSRGAVMGEAGYFGAEVVVANGITSWRVTTGADGSFNFRSMPVGSYYLVALRDEEAADWREQSFLENLTRLAMTITIADGEHKVQDLRR